MTPAQIFPLVSLVLLIQWQICHRCQRRRWHMAIGINDTSSKFATCVYDTGGKKWDQLSNCWQLFLIEDFFHFPPLSMTPVVQLELRISLRFFENIWNSPNAIIRGLGETDPCRKPEVKNLVAPSREGGLPPPPQISIPAWTVASAINLNHKTY